MAKKRRRSSRGRAVILAGLFWPVLRSAWACAGYTNKLTTTPDFVQDNFGPAGDELPNDGLQYCCPTAVAMSLSYLGVNGFNQIGPSDPTAAQGLNLVDVLSGFMQTNATFGTPTNGDIVNAIDLYLDAKGIGSSSYSVATYAAPTISALTNLNQNQTVVDLICGYYNPAGERTGGHCVALDAPGVNSQGQSSPDTLAVNNPLPSAFAPFPDDPANSVQYDNTIATSGSLTAAGALELDPSQYSGYGGPNQTVVETAIAVTVNATEQSVNNPAISPWTLSATQSLNLNDGALSVIAPLLGAGGIDEGTGGVLDLEAADNTTGGNTVVAGSLESNITSGQPFGSGSISVDAGTLELLPNNAAANVSLAAANGAGSAITFSEGSSLILDANGNNSLTLTIGGNTDAATPNLVRSGNGTLVIACADGIANLGLSDRLVVAGSGANLPLLSNGIVAPYIVGQNNDTNASGDFLTYNANGFAVASYVTSAASLLYAAGGNAIYEADANQALANNETAEVYALKVDGITISGGSGSTLDVGPQSSGELAGLIMNGGVISVPNLNFGAAEGLVYASNANGTISSAIQGSGGLTKFGPGALILSGNNAYTGDTNIESGTLIAANTIGSATSSGAVTVDANATLEVSGAAAQAGGSGGTTINDGGTLWLHGGTLAGTLIENGDLEGQGTISGQATLGGTIRSTAATGPTDLTFTGGVTLASGNSTIFSWQLDALDDKPADAGTSWSLLNFTDGNQVYFGNGSANSVHYILDLGAGVPDPNSGNPFWNAPHQWLVSEATPDFQFLYYDSDFPSFAQGAFTVTNNPTYTDVYADYTPFAQPQGAVAGTWNAGGGSWSNGGNWLNNVIPQSVGDTANFTLATAAASNITLDADWIAGVVNFNNSQSYTLSAGTGGMLTLANGQLNAQINDAGGTQTISAPILLDSNLIVAVSDTGDTMNLSGSISGPGSLTVNGNGAVTLSGQNSYQGATSAALGTLVINSHISLPATTDLTIGTNSTVATVRLVTDGGSFTLAGLTINPGSTLDIAGDALTINYSSSSDDPIAALRGYLLSGYNNGKWTGPGIVSSDAAANPGLYGIGYADGNTDAGTPAGANQIYIQNVLVGDTNMDGSVNFSDLLRVAQDFGRTGQDWADGDFNYDGVVNFTDLLAMAQNFGKVLSQGEITQLPFSFEAEWQLAQVEMGAAYSRPVPEPAMIGAWLLGAAALAGRRRRANFS